MSDSFKTQVGDRLPEILTDEERALAAQDMLELRRRYPKLAMREGQIGQFATPPGAPDKWVFAQTTRTILADLTTGIISVSWAATPTARYVVASRRCACLLLRNTDGVGLFPLAPCSRRA